MNYTSDWHYPTFRYNMCNRRSQFFSSVCVYFRIKKIDLKVDYPCNVLLSDEFSIDGKFMYISIQNNQVQEN